MSNRNALQVIAAVLVLARGATAQAPKPAPTPVGTWRGTSICLVRPSACNDETVVYRIVRTKKADSLSMDALKLVNGSEESMGILACRLDATGSEINCPIPSGIWHFAARGDSLIGDLKRPDGTKFRDVKAIRSR